MINTSKILQIARLAKWDSSYLVEVKY
jgi:hypothetical protein